MVYYSGHGGYVHPLPGEAVEVARTNRQFIVPTDYGESKPGDFRGITAVELSVLLGRLTERTDNAVVVLDCCHSAMMSRDPGALLAKQVPDATMVDLQAHVRKQVEAGLAVDLAEPEGNKKAVRVAACGQDQFAYQQRQAGVTGAYGLLTEALVTALREAAGVRVSWARLIVRVRQLVQLNFAHQWPSAEGPSERVLFETRADDAVGSLPVVVVDDATARIDGAAVLGVQVGDEFAVVPGTVAEFDPADAVAEVRIERRTPTDASGPLTYLTRGGECRRARVRTGRRRPRRRCPCGCRRSWRTWCAPACSPGSPTRVRTRRWRWSSTRTGCCACTTRSVRCTGRAGQGRRRSGSPR